MLLKHIATVLCNFVRKDDLVARIGGDEFIILFNTIDADITPQMLQRLKELPKEHPLVYSQEDVIEFSFSLGLASYPQDAQDALSLVKKADKAMYTNKRDS
jgi:diguanylate cyclase (GGDEF)-like protein